ncbi:MAG: type II toxin-antitoxin system RelE/ParE family toxin [Candidatus Aminicenantes bacterium]|nr:MAG: type II toxin-antitoxin system RelE/ParE family toxin [Candidatus Aminicenantes bacterium]
MESLKNYIIKYTREAKKRIEKLDPSVKQIIKKAIDSLSLNPYRGKPLAYELAGLYSLRTSDYRIIYRVKEKELIIIIITVGHRREIYKKLKALIEKEFK